MLANQNHRERTQAKPAFLPALAALLRSLAHLLRRNLARGFWLIMLAGHFPAARTALQTLVSDSHSVAWSRLFLLIASLTFFSLKVADVRWLRLPRDRRVLASVVAIFALLHADVVRRSITHETLTADIPVAALTTLTAAATLLGGRWVQRFSRVGHVTPRVLNFRPARWLAQLRLEAVPRLLPVQVCPSVIWRGPPRA